VVELHENTHLLHQRVLCLTSNRATQKQATSRQQGVLLVGCYVWVWFSFTRILTSFTSAFCDQAGRQAGGGGGGRQARRQAGRQAGGTGRQAGRQAGGISFTSAFCDQAGRQAGWVGGWAGRQEVLFSCTCGSVAGVVELHKNTSFTKRILQWKGNT
jgi:hypothetical protein